MPNSDSDSDRKVIHLTANTQFVCNLFSNQFGRLEEGLVFLVCICNELHCERLHLLLPVSCHLHSHSITMSYVKGDNAVQNARQY